MWTLGDPFLQKAVAEITCMTWQIGWENSRTGRQAKALSDSVGSGYEHRFYLGSAIALLLVFNPCEGPPRLTFLPALGEVRKTRPADN